MTTTERAVMKTALEEDDADRRRSRRSTAAKLRTSWRLFRRSGQCR